MTTLNSTVLGLLAETFIHPGSGSDTGFVDLPVAREAATDYPVIYGSSFKGALLDLVRSNDTSAASKLFGERDNAGALLVSDVRLLLLPVRSMTSHYKWITCPHLIERFDRDAVRSGSLRRPVAFEGPSTGSYLGEGAGDLFLEERQFQPAGSLPDGLIAAIAPLVPHEAVRKRLASQLVVLSDGDFAWFARYGLAVNARNVLDTEKKTSKNLWYEETIPPDSLFYCLLAERQRDAVSAIANYLGQRPYIQAGGNATIGQGWFAVALLNGASQ